MVVDIAQFRLELDNLDYPWVDRISDPELEAWLFKPGSNRYQIFEWALSLIDPATREDFLRSNDSDIVEVTTKVLVNQGLCRSAEKDIVSGHAVVEKQKLLWNKIFYECRIMKDWDKMSKDQRASLPDPFKLLTSLFSSTDFWDLLEKKPKLFPVTLPKESRPVGSLKDLQRELENAKEELEEASCALNASEIQSSSREKTSGCTSFRSSHTGTPKMETDCKDREKYIAQLRCKIDEYYKTLMEQLVPALQKRPRDPAGVQLAEMVKNLSPSLTVYAQFIKDEDEIKKLTSSFLDNPKPTNISGLDSLSDIVSSILEELSAILALLRSKNNDV